jgi:mono/diheme cytochrome c family protein
MSLPRPLCALLLALLGSLCLVGCLRKQEPSHSGASDSLRTIDTSRIASFTPSRLSYEERQGRDLFMKYCSVCHGAQGKGDGFNSFNLDPKPRNLADGVYMNTLLDERIAQTIREGGRGVNRSSLMPSWGERLSKNEILNLVAFVRTLPADTTQ